MLDPQACYKALQTGDARFDGRLFVGVTSTGIYCRPVCPARPPKPENCRYFPSAAAARDAGFRPCLRCRPETAPDRGAWLGTSNTVSRGLALIAQGELDANGAGVDRLARRLGVGGRQLRRLFRQHLGASPIAVAQTQRILFAKQLIHETRLPMAEVAFAAGFTSIRRYNEVFQELFGRTPSALRQGKGSAASPSGGHGAVGATGITIRLRYRPPYDWPAMLGHLAHRAVPGIERVVGNAYACTVEHAGQTGTVLVAHDPDAQSLKATVRFSSAGALSAIVGKIRRVFDVAADVTAIADHLARDPLLAPLVAARPGLRIPGAWDGFELAVRAVLGQQVSVSAARDLAFRLACMCGTAMAGERNFRDPLTHVFPTAQQVARLAGADRSALGVSGARLRTLVSVAAAAAADPLLFEPLATVEETVSRLRAIRGVGDWTAHTIALRAGREPDAFPSSDRGLIRSAARAAGAMVDPAGLLAMAERWRPWRAYAAQHLWAADRGRTAAKKGSAMTDCESLWLDHLETPLGRLAIVATRDGRLRAVGWVQAHPRMARELLRRGPARHETMTPESNPGGFTAALREYFEGRVGAIDRLPVEPRGTEFQRAVWGALHDIPCGDTRSYADVARRIGRPTAVRAVGLANGANPVGIVVPCHRVIGSNGSLTGYGGGVERKRWLLNHEQGSARGLPLPLRARDGEINCFAHPRLPTAPKRIAPQD